LGLEFQYRIKTEGESYERVAVEHQLEGTAQSPGEAAALPSGLKPSKRKSTSSRASALSAEDAGSVFAVRS
jgi:hypothetical protein